MELHSSIELGPSYQASPYPGNYSGGGVSRWASLLPIIGQISGKCAFFGSGAISLEVLATEISDENAICDCDLEILEVLKVPEEVPSVKAFARSVCSSSGDADNQKMGVEVENERNSKTMQATGTIFDYENRRV